MTGSDWRAGLLVLWQALIGWFIDAERFRLGGFVTSSSLDLDMCQSNIKVLCRDWTTTKPHKQNECVSVCGLMAVQRVGFDPCGS